MRLLVDGIVFQVKDLRIARVWQSVLPYLVRCPGMQIYMLDRGNAPVIEGISCIPFPDHLFAQCADDSILIQRVCDLYEIDVFTSTLYTTPLSTPMLGVICDMIPELCGFDLMQRAWSEKDTATCFAQRYLCISESTRSDLLSFYPEIPQDKASVAYCGADADVFKIRPAEEVSAFLQTYRLDRDYFLYSGSPPQSNGHSNSPLFFSALRSMPSADFDVLCVDCESEIKAEWLEHLPTGVRCIRATLNDDERSLAYNGARALVYPSLFDGLATPMIEAMASGCPVIATRDGSIAEICGDAACLVDGAAVEEMCAALRNVREPDYREALKRKGVDQARFFSWRQVAEQFARDAFVLNEEARQGLYDDFFERWRWLREVQASVDF